MKLKKNQPVQTETEKIIRKTSKYFHTNMRRGNSCETLGLNKFYPLPLSCTKTCDDQFDKESRQTFGQKLALFVLECTLSICTPSPYL
jgi:hypothetical protein